MKNSKKVAFGGIVGALSLVSMFLSGIFPFAEYTCPALAGIFLIALVIDFNKKTALIAYGAVSILSLLIMPNKEASILFVAFLGYYPILKSILEQCKSRVVEWILKVGIFNVTVLLSYYFIIHILGMSQVLDDMQGFAQYGVLVLLVMGNVAFIIYDIALTRLIATYVHSIRPKFKGLL
ncbi:hypothetical protein RBG61_02600 [Paludicola sp. MB14-C6]|uniref:hypothetical protein n=1 Tax=Paludihabitans sp. MB14-C6 TaxID=3070656 RepID=UPI0027DAE75E|nr:hypothetical protein [Paludicola sp. MB14-C6]WMJ23583.1 hypothetical protein RBG61_02600 [Paludicola sp. MB14-C6]